jgi:signal transduction histidine kinase
VVIGFVVLMGIVGWLLTRAGGPHWIWPLLWIVILVLIGRGVYAVIGGIRGGAGPLGDLIEASGRVEAGQFGVQVAERGPREIRAMARAFNGMSARLAATDEQRRRLLADVSHELRTPLTVIQGNVEAMLDGVYPADRDHLERILAEARQLERLIDDLRTLSQAETGSLTLQREPTDVALLAREVVAGFEPQAAAAGVALVVEAAEDAPEVAVDPRRLRQVVTNLVSNALRHTAAGGRVVVSVGSAAEGVVLEVADDGGGMDEATAARAFERFSRAADSPGAGLGLPIVRDLVEAHGGTVSLSSVLGKGTRVRCVLPA